MVVEPAAGVDSVVEGVEELPPERGPDVATYPSDQTLGSIVKVTPFCMLKRSAFPELVSTPAASMVIAPVNIVAGSSLLATVEVGLYGAFINVVSDLPTDREVFPDQRPMKALQRFALVASLHEPAPGLAPQLVIAVSMVATFC